MEIKRYSFSLIEVLIAGALLATLAVPLYLMLISSTRSSVQAIEEVQATLLAEELIESMRSLSMTYMARCQSPLPSVPEPCWRHQSNQLSPVSKKNEKWADIDKALKLEGTGMPLTIDSVERQRSYLQPEVKGYKRYLRISYPVCYDGEKRDPLICQVRALIVYSAYTGSKKKEKRLELCTLITIEDVIAKLSL